MIPYLLLVSGLLSTWLPIPTSLSHPFSSSLVYAEIFDEEREEFLVPPRIAYMWVTAYSSTPEETDETPFVTASGERVRDGIVAMNSLPFGTEIQIPELFGDKVFVVKDRMHRRKSNFVDVWMATKKEAKDFGITYTSIVISSLP